MKTHIMNTCRSSYMHIRKINSIRRYLTEHATKSLMNSTVLVGLDYCNSTYVGQTSASTKYSCKSYSGTPRHEHITPTLQQMNWLSITKRCQMKLLVMTFKVLHQEAPQYIMWGTTFSIVHLTSSTA